MAVVSPRLPYLDVNRTADSEAVQRTLTTFTHALAARLEAGAIPASRA